MTCRVLVVHRVEDYPTWKAVFDEAAALRYAGGERSYQVLTDVGDPNVVVHLATWTGVREARAFFESPEVVEIRRRAGAEPPFFSYLELREEAELSGR